MVINLMYSRIGLNLQSKFYNTYAELDKDFVPPTDTKNIDYFDRLKSSDHRAWLSEEQENKQNYKIHRLGKKNFAALSNQKTV